MLSIAEHCSGDAQEMLGRCQNWNLGQKKLGALGVLRIIVSLSEVRGVIVFFFSLMEQRVLVMD